MRSGVQDRGTSSQTIERSNQGSGEDAVSRLFNGSGGTKEIVCAAGSQEDAEAHCLAIVKSVGGFSGHPFMYVHDDDFGEMRHLPGRRRTTHLACGGHL